MGSVLKPAKKVLKTVAKIAPFVAPFIPGIGPLAAAAIGAASGLASGGGLRGALLGGVTGGLGGGLGSRIGGNLLGQAASSAASRGIGGALTGAVGGLASGRGLKGALTGAALGGAGGFTFGGGLDNTLIGRTANSISSGASGALNDFGRFSGLGDVYNSASGALNKVSSSVGDAYEGSALQGAFRSGGDALQSIGIGGGSEGISSAPSSGAGTSVYSSDAANGFDAMQNPANLTQNAVLQNAPDYGTGAMNTVATGVPEVARTNFLSPIASALLGNQSNSQAEEALMKGQRANQRLLEPYADGFQFTPGDLTQDPGYQFNLEQGTQAVDRAQLARGGYFSGGAAKELAQFNQGLADNTYGSAFSRALQGREAGLTGALANAGVNTNMGNIRANSATNRGNLFSGALGSLLGGNSFDNTGALQGGFDMQEFLRRNGIGTSAYAG